MTPSLYALLLSLGVSVTNPLPVPRENVPVVVKIPSSKSEINSAVIAGHPDIPYQLDDLDLDGRPDEIALLVNLKGSETKNLTISFSSKDETRSFTPGTYAHLKLNDKGGKHPKIQAISYPGTADNRQMYSSIYGHGSVLEGQYSAIRVYMDNRQSVDLYAKNTPRLELAETNFYTTRDQLASGYGRDILWAGTSVALGSFRGWENSRPATIDSVESRTQRILATGPVRSIVEVIDEGWVSNGKKADMTQRYTVYAGHRDYNVDIHLSPASSDATYCTGVQKLMTDNVGFVDTDGLAGSWGSNLPDKNLPEVTDTLGLGIYVRAPYLAKTLEDDVNYLTLLKTDSKGNIHYKFTSAALRDETSPRTADEWFAYLREWKKMLDNPVKITVKKK